MLTESQRRIDELSAALSRMKETTREAGACCDSLTRRARQLDSLTSPASETSAKLTEASNNLGATLVIMKDAREKFDTVSDCEPAIQRLLQGAQELEMMRSTGGNAKDKGGKFRPGSSKKKGSNSTSKNFVDGDGTGSTLTEQDVYAAADSMEIIRDAYSFFLERKSWRSAPSAMGRLERVHQLGVDGMCLLVRHHLTAAGPAVRMKRFVKGQEGFNIMTSKNETAAKTRIRLNAALQNRDLMKSVGEYEEYLPLDTRPVRELRAIFECLGGENSNLGPPIGNGPRPNKYLTSVSKVVRTEKIGSGGYTNLVKELLKTGFPHLDSYGEARKAVAFASIDGYFRHIRADRKKISMKSRGAMSGDGPTGEHYGDLDTAARDAVRCLEHAMVIVAGEKSIYRCVISPTSSHTHDETKVKPEYKEALVASYSHVVAAVVDRSMDIIETVFLKETSAPGGVSSPGGGDSPSASNTSKIRAAASAAAAGMRILDGVRMLGPSLAKLCDMSSEGRRSDENNMSVAGSLCISIHRTTVKNTARTLENLSKAIQSDPLDGEKYRPPDARVAAVSSDAVRAIRLIAPFTSAYKSVTKRRALQWDQNIGDDAGDLNSFIRFLIMRLLDSLQSKAINYTKDPGLDSIAKSHLFLMNNTFYLLEQLGSPFTVQTRRVVDEEIDGEQYKVEGPWFKDKVNKIFETEKQKYLAHWEILNRHLTAVDENELIFQSGSDKLLSLESGRLLKSRFSGFIEDFEKIYAVHKALTVIDPKLRELLQVSVKGAFAPRYRKFFGKYSKIQFSKKNMDQYLKYPPQRVDAMVGELYTQ